MSLTPFVYWAQTEGEITLRVDVQTDDVKTAQVCIEDEEVEVTAVGIGAQSGLAHYHFVLEFYMPVDSRASSYLVKDTGIQITLVKKEMVRRVEIWLKLHAPARIFITKRFKE